MLTEDAAVGKLPISEQQNKLKCLGTKWKREQHWEGVPCA